MDKIEGLTEGPILVTNREGKDDDEEWHLPDFGRDGEFWGAMAIFRRLSDDGKYAYDGGWAQQIATHIEVIDLFKALDSLIAFPKQASES